MPEQKCERCDRPSKYKAAEFDADKGCWIHWTHPPFLGWNVCSAKSKLIGNKWVGEPAPVVSTAAPEPPKVCKHCGENENHLKHQYDPWSEAHQVNDHEFEPVAPESYKPAEKLKREPTECANCKNKIIPFGNYSWTHAAMGNMMCNLSAKPAATPVTVEAPKVEEVKADNLFGVYCNGNPESVPKDRAIYWEGWQRVADYVNRLRHYSQQTSTARKSPDSHLGAVRA